MLDPLRQENTELRKILKEYLPVKYLVPLNRINWISDSLTRWRLTEDNKTYTVYSSSTVRKDPYDEKFSLVHSPNNLFTESWPENWNCWASQPDEQNNSWIIIELPCKEKSNYLRIKSRNDCEDQCQSKFEIRGSNKNGFEPGTFKVFMTIDGFKLRSNEVKEIPFNNEEEFQFYSIFIYSVNGSRHAAIGELNFGHKYK